MSEIPKVKKIKVLEELNLFPPMEGESIEKAFKRSIKASPTYGVKKKPLKKKPKKK